MSEIDWSKAPEGATHWGADTENYREAWYKKCEGNWFFSNKDTKFRWVMDFGIGPDRAKEMLGRTSEWSGEGLPPEGTVCEFRHDDVSDWQTVTVKYVSEYTVLVEFDNEPFKGHEGAYSPSDCRLRPLRTPEQIAVDQREKAIDEIASLIGRGTFSEDAAAIYDAGYRKVEGGAE